MTIAVSANKTVGTGLTSRPITAANSTPPISTILVGLRSATGGASSVSKNSEQRVGTMTIATKSEEVSVMIRVSGRNLMNLPTMPGQKIIGKNAAKVVTVDTIIGMATSPVPILAAVFRS